MRLASGSPRCHDVSSPSMPSNATKEALIPRPVPHALDIPTDGGRRSHWALHSRFGCIREPISDWHYKYIMTIRPMAMGILGGGLCRCSRTVDRGSCPHRLGERRLLVARSALYGMRFVLKSACGYSSKSLPAQKRKIDLYCEQNALQLLKVLRKRKRENCRAHTADDFDTFKTTNAEAIVSIEAEISFAFRTRGHGIHAGASGHSSCGLSWRVG